MCIVNIASIWFIDNKFGVSLRLSQVLLQASNKLPKFAFQGLVEDTPAADDGAEEEYYEEEVDE